MTSENRNSHWAVMALALVGCQPERGPDGLPLPPPPSPPGHVCNAEHVSEERVRHVSTYMRAADEGAYFFETCLPVHRADGSVYTYQWAAYRVPRNDALPGTR